MNSPFTPNITRLKKHRRRFPGGTIDIRTVNLIKNTYGLQAIENGMLFSNHIEMCRKTITNFYSRQIKPFIRCYPNTSYTSKPFDVRRGRGKGGIDSWYQYIRENKIIMEFESPTVEQALNVARIVRSKMPFKIMLVTKEILEKKKLEKTQKHKIENNV